MNTTKFKMFGMILKANYVQKEAVNKLMEAIAKYEASVYGKKNQCDDFDQKVLPANPYPTEDEDRIWYNMLFAQMRSGEYERVYIIYDSKVEQDYYRENAYPKSDRYAHKNIPKRFADEYHAQDNRIQVPEKFGDVDRYLHWLVSNAGDTIDIAHIDMNEGNVKAYSVSDEYFAPIEHKEYSQEVEDWAIALGVPREVAEAYIEMYKKEYPPTWEHHMYLTANGGTEPGTTPDAQVVKCPVCGRPTWAAPASVGFQNYTGEYIPVSEDSKQMTCEHCKADLSPCFNR